MSSKERVKMIWDFRGPNAQRTAEHHVIHLKEFAKTEGLQNWLCEVEQISEMNSTAFLVVEKEVVDDLRQRLKPHRGQWYQE